MDRETLLARIKAALKTVHGDRLQGIIFYGSEARNASAEDSDIDVLVVLRGPIGVADDLACIDALYPLVLEQERPIHAICVDAAVYEAGEYPLYQNAKATGIVL
jgi:predicted nucleotidyltransferase